VMPLLLPFFFEIDIKKMNIGLLTLSGHNMYAPTGIGVLYTSEQILPLFEGGNQELGLRPGTENYPGASALGVACECIAANRSQWNQELACLAERLWQGLAQKTPFIHFTGHPTQRLPGHVSFWVEHIEGESLLLLLNMKGVMAASGSACSSNLKGHDEEDLMASHVLTAIGVPNDICAGSITFSLAKYNTGADVDYVLEIMPGIVEKLLAMSPSYSDYMRKKELLHE
jgi:cysteine desulfurase